MDAQTTALLTAFGTFILGILEWFRRRKRDKSTATAKEEQRLLTFHTFVFDTYKGLIADLTVEVKRLRDQAIQNEHECSQRIAELKREVEALKESKP